MRNYSYSIEEVKKGYLESLDGFYVSHCMKDCIQNLENELKLITN